MKPQYIRHTYDADEYRPIPPRAGFMTLCRQLRTLEESTEPNTLQETGRYYFDVLEFSPDVFPTVEKEYLINPNNWMDVIPYTMRPTEKITREYCNTIRGRMQLLSWQYGLPNITDGVEQTTIVTTTEGANIWGEKSINRIIDAPASWYTSGEIKKLFSGIWFPQYGAIVGTPYDIAYNKDMGFARRLGVEITTRDDFQQAAEMLAPSATIERLMESYDQTQFMIDCLFATYELFRTEKYESIAQFPIYIQRAAILNYFAKFRYYGNRGRTVYNAGGVEFLEYKKPRYVITNMAKYMGIPPDVLAYVKRPRVAPITSHEQGQRTIAPKPRTQTAGTKTEKPKVAQISKEPDKQRTDRIKNGQQLDLIFAEHFGEEINDLLLFDRELLNNSVVLDTANRKLYNEILYQIASDPEFNVAQYAAEVAAAQTPDDVRELFRGKVFTIDINELVKNVYGTITQEGKEQLHALLTNIQKEVFVFYRRIVKTDRNGTPKRDRGGNEIATQINPKNKKKYKVEEREFAVISPRFQVVAWIPAKEGNKRTAYCTMYVNPIYFANMLDAHGNITNYRQLTDNYMEYNRALRNDDVITPALEKILSRLYDQRFCMASGKTKAIKQQAKEQGEPTPDKQTLETLTNASFTITVSKDNLYNAVLKNAGLPLSQSTMQKRRTQEKIDKGLAMLQRYGVMIDAYRSINGNKFWQLFFIRPSK